MEEELILASTSAYRRVLLERLGVRFRCESPAVAETALPGESGVELSTRLSRLKAAAVAARHPQTVVIGSDQVAVLDGRLLGKPGTHEKAREQLRASSGRRLQFFTGVALVTDATLLQERCVRTEVRFRPLAEEEIERYLRREQPYDCAGSFKCEGLGISLFEGISSEDPTALEGLPLIALSAMLRASGIAVP